jgi:hypothetical protein
MNSSPKSAGLITLGILLTVAVLLPLTITRLTGASSTSAFRTPAVMASASSAAFEPAPFFAGFTVDSLADTATGSGTSGTLRYCITQANAAGGSDTITFSVTGTITLTSALPSISSDLAITGPGVNLLTVSGNNALRVFRTAGTAALTISNLMIANGNAASGNFGGGVYHTSSSTLTISNCVIRNCSALIGGGVFNESTAIVNITNSSIRNCSASVGGGGVYNNVAGTINIIGCTLNNNSATSGAAGGGLFNNDNSGSHINITNSTFSGNSGSGGAGLFSARGAVAVTNCTFASNPGGAIAISAGSLQLKNSIVAQSGGADISGAVTSLGYNLIGNAGGAAGFPAGSPNANQDYVGTGASPINPQLALLADNGGPTQTHALLGGSLAIDHGSAAAGVTTDQRGSTRPFDEPGVSPATGGNNSDIGAFEAGIFVLVGGNTTYTPTVPPVGAVRMNVSSSTNFKGTFVGNSATGVVKITNAHPAGSHVVLVKAFDSGGAITTTAFNLTVQTPTPVCAAATFTAAANVPTDVNACSLAVADFNNDGKQDLAVANNTGDNVSIRLGDGVGGFTGSTNVPVGPASHPGHGIQPNQIVIGDFNNDGNQDFATANLHVGSVSIRLGNGAGGFTGETATSEITTGGNSDAQGLAIGDFNSDGKQDLVVCNSQSSNFSILLGDGVGGFTISSTTTLFAPFSAAVGDFNSDGKQDLLLTSFDNVVVRLGDGLGGFSGSTSISVGNRPSSIAIGDFNNDGKQDFAAAAPGFTLGNNTAAVRLGDGLGGFSGSTSVTVGTGNYWIAVGDFNRDGKHDFVTANFNANTSSVVLGDGVGGFGAASSVSVGGHPISIAIGDFNGDTSLDFATANVSSNNATVRLGSCGAAAPNTAPTITAQSGVTRQQGSPASNSQIATVGDAETGAAGVTVTVTSANPSNGVTLSNIVNSAGNVTANIIASCTATNATFTLQASDGSLTSTASLNVTVTANTPPSLTYANQSVGFGGSTTISPAAAGDNGSITGYTIQSVVPALTTAPTVNASGVVSITNAQPSGNHVITIRATDNCGSTTDSAVTLSVNNAPPTIAAAGPLSRQQASAAINSQIATVSDPNQAANTLNITTTPVTGAGVTVSGISVAAGGNVTANVSASCMATNSTFTLTMTDSQSASATATLTINVTANTSPTLTYASPQSTVFNGSLLVTPAAASDNGTITGYSVQSVVPPLVTAPTVNAAGVVSIVNAQPSGSHVITIRVTDNCGATTDSAFALNVGSAPPTITAAGPLSRQQGSAASNSQIATVTDADDPLASLTVTVNSSSSATVNGVTVSNLTVDASGVVKADVGASCGASNASFTLTVTDSAGLMNTATLNVTVTPNPAPSLGGYSNTSLSLGAGGTVMPLSPPGDNGSIAGISASAPGFTGSFLVNQSSGVVTIAGAGPVGTFSVTVTASDNCGAVSTQIFSLTVTGSACGGVDLGAPTSFSAGTGPLQVAVGDFNLDGKTDLAIANLVSNDVTILLNNGSGGFTQPPGSPLGPFPTSEQVQVGDFNLDGKPDLAVLSGGSSQVIIMLGNGVGGFTQAAGSPVNTGSGTFPFALTIGDFNQDGRPDVATANGGTNNVTVLLGNGSGGLVAAPGSPFAAGTRPRSITTGDFNGDLRADLAVANENSGNVTILLGAGGGAFAPAPGSPIAVGAGAQAVAVGDFNLDNNVDLAAASQGTSSVIILLGNGSGTFAQPAGSPITGLFAAHKVVVSDFDLDGKQDLAVQIAITGQTVILRGNGSGGFTTQILTIGVNPQTLTVGDFNLDGKPDLVTANHPTNDVTTLLNVCTPNQPPTITGATLSRSRGATPTTSQIATVSDADQDPNTLSVTVNGGASATVNGVTVNTIAIDPAGNVTASVGATCAATDATFTLTVTDTRGVSATAILTVNVTPDSEAPVLTACPVNIIQPNDPTLCTAVVTYTPPAATDNCGSATVVCSPLSGSSFVKGVTTVTCVATDGAGNTSSCSFTVTVNDTEAPAITCPANMTRPNDPGQCAAVVTYANATATDNCSGVGTPVCVPASGASFPKGTTTVTCTVNDGAGNGSSCTFTVTVNDTQAPSIACPANITTPNDPGQCSAVVSYTTPAASDNCAGVGAVTCIPASGSTFPIGTTTVTCSATDSGGNSGSCGFSVIVTDTQAPAITCPANVVRANDSGQCGAVVTYANATATDNCPGAGAPTCAPASGSTFPRGVTTVTCNVSDAGGNTASCAFTVTVNDTQAPSITCPANITKANDSGQCSAVVTYATPSASDNCPGTATVTCSPASGSTFAKGTTSVTCTATDPSGNSSSCTFSVTVTDTQAPTIACPASITKATDPNQCSALVTYTTPPASDNCPGVGAVTCSPPSGSTFPKGTSTVTCSTTDASKNQGSCAFTVTVNDVQLPTIVGPANITKATDPNQCSAVVAYSAPSVSDNCPGVGAPICSPLSGAAFAKGTTIVTCTVNDAAGNQSSSSFTVTVNDTQAPTITCPPTQTRTLVNPADATVVVTYPSPAYSDNCAGTAVVCVPPSGAAFPATGVTTVTCTATDASGNSSSCAFNVAIFDVCLQDESMSGTVLVFNSYTGDYVFCCGGTTYTGRGTVQKQGGIYTLTHNMPTRRVLGRLEVTQKRGTGTLQSPVGVMKCSISDRDTRNNSCSCSAPQ